MDKECAADRCDCGHDHLPVHPPQVLPPELAAGILQTKVYLLENLVCANCAAKMEVQINALPTVSQATVTFATKQLQVIAPAPNDLLEQIRKICASIEAGVVVIERAGQETISVLPQRFWRVSRSLLEIIGGLLLFICAEFLDLGASPAVMLLVLAYVILGGRIVATATKNLFHGRIFDENFLMSIATIGAFLIQEYPEAVGVMLFYRIGAFFEHKAVEKSRSQIMSAVDLRPQVVHAMVGGKVAVIAAAEAKVGDLLLVRPGDRIPLDGIVACGESLIDTSAITGEPVPRKVMPGNLVTSGCVNTSGVLQIRVKKILAESMVTRILDSVEHAAASKPRIDRFITRFARIYTPIVVAGAVCTALIPSMVTGNWGYWVYTALTFLVISCPCALVLSVPLAFFAGIGAGSKQGILFKGGASLEAMQKIKVVAMDKTGTITQGKFALRGIVSAGVMEDHALLALCASCERSSTHPIAVSIVEAAVSRGLALEQPFLTEEVAGKGIRAQLAAGEVLCGNRALFELHHVVLADDPADHWGAQVFIALNGQWIGQLVIDDMIKEDAPRAVKSIRDLGIAAAMLTGDDPQSAAAVAKQVGIVNVHAKLLPQDKWVELQNLRAQYGSVMFVGDGINDAPVLAGADVGAAMGSGADAAIEAADVVFMTSKLTAIPQALSIARHTSQIAWQNVIGALAVKALVMIWGLGGYASMWMAVFADTGVSMLCVLNSVRILYKK